MKKIVLLCLTILLVNNLFAGPRMEMIAHKWVYSGVEKEENLDEVGKRLTASYFEGSFLYFMENGKYKAFLMGKEDFGIWILNKEETEVLFHSHSGTNITFQIVDLTDTQLILQIGNEQERVIFSKTTPTTEDAEFPTDNPNEFVAVTTDLLSQKWFFVKRVDPLVKNSESRAQLNEVVSEMMSETYFHLKKSGKIQVSTLGIKENGKWDLNDTQTGFIAHFLGENRIWNVLSVSDSELVLVRGKSSETWHFTTEKPKNR